MQEAAWDAWVEGEWGRVQALYRARGIETDKKLISDHFARHRPRQGQGQKLTAAEALEAANKLTSRRQAVLALLFRCPGMSVRQISDLIYLGENPGSALPSALRDLRYLQRRGFLFQVFLEQIPGGGPRTSSGHPGLWFPGRHSRPFFRQIQGRAARLGKEWWSGVGDWDSWQEAYQCWQRAEDRALLLSQLPLLGRGYRGGAGMRVDWAGIYDHDQASFRFPDPLLGMTRFRAESVLGVSVAEGTVPIFLQHDRGSRPLEDVADQASRLAALHRSGELEGRFDLPAGARSLLLLLTDSPDRVIGLRSYGRRVTVAGDSPALVCDTRTAAGGLERECWQPLFSEGPSISLLHGLRGLARWPILPAGRHLALRRSLKPQPEAEPAISSSGEVL